jgi:hypothetical protein
MRQLRVSALEKRFDRYLRNRYGLDQARERSLIRKFFESIRLTAEGEAMQLR